VEARPRLCKLDFAEINQIDLWSFESNLSLPSFVSGLVVSFVILVTS
jgi:hypothetical protein